MADICDVPLRDIKKGTTVRVRYFERGTGSLCSAVGEFISYDGESLIVEQRGVNLSNANEFLGWQFKEREIDYVYVF